VIWVNDESGPRANRCKRASDYENLEARWLRGVSSTVYTSSRCEDFVWTGEVKHLNIVEHEYGDAPWRRTI